VRLKFPIVPVKTLLAEKAGLKSGGYWFQCCRTTAGGGEDQGYH